MRSVELVELSADGSCPRCGAYARPKDSAPAPYPASFSDAQARTAREDSAMRAKGYRYRLEFPPACGIEPLYVKSPDQAARLLRTEYRGIAGILSVPI